MSTTIEAVQVNPLHTSTDANPESKGRKTWPEDLSPLSSQLSYSYIYELLKLGATAGRTLSAEDLYGVSETETSAKLTSVFHTHFRSRSSNDVGTVSNLCVALWALVRTTMLEAGWYNLIACASQVYQPLILKDIVDAASIRDPTEARSRGLVGALLVAVVVTAQVILIFVFKGAFFIFFLFPLLLGFCAQAFSQQRAQHLAMRAGQRMRATVVAEVFDTALRLTPKGREGLSKGVSALNFSSIN